jgi:hypothetical protein
MGGMTVTVTKECVMDNTVRAREMRLRLRLRGLKHSNIRERGTGARIKTLEFRLADHGQASSRMRDSG